MGWSEWKNLSGYEKVASKTVTILTSHTLVASNLPYDKFYFCKIKGVSGGALYGMLFFDSNGGIAAAGTSFQQNNGSAFPIGEELISSVQGYGNLYIYTNQSAYAGTVADIDVYAMDKADFETVRALIPAMTSNTTPSGVASASSIVSAHYDAWCALRYVDDLPADDALYKRWNSGAPGNGQWLKYEFNEAVTCSAFKIYPLLHSNTKTLMLKSYKLQGSNNDSTWDDLYSETLQNVATNKRVSITNNTAYKYYRILATSDSYFSNGSISIINFQLYENK